jgi:hypothetical protein
MSYIGSDDQPLCDGPCNRMCPPGWPNWIEPWPVKGPLWDFDGRMTRERRDSFHLCLDCLQAMVLKSHLSRDAREIAVISRDRWQASQALLDEAEAVLRGSTA